MEEGEEEEEIRVDQPAKVVLEMGASQDPWPPPFLGLRTVSRATPFNAFTAGKPFWGKNYLELVWGLGL